MTIYYKQKNTIRNTARNMLYQIFALTFCTSKQRVTFLVITSLEKFAVKQVKLV